MLEKIQRRVARWVTGCLTNIAVFPPYYAHWDDLPWPSIGKYHD